MELYLLFSVMPLEHIFNLVKIWANTSFAGCFRDHSKKFSSALTKLQHVSLSTIEGEVYALFKAMKTASDKGFDRVVFVSDSQEVTNAINSNHG
jgi:ribonuclease HI